ncbi:ferrochelatase [Boudabousia marimammalium]|uniref:Coproporphyrin III ferrochelatase n=1 Tax=Boudabousia marimammalium TaxID=156892 RepID=A0A1Q5PQZ1_9ACTO|nr:ferrochelatase [Boudabousia marimammalium]OKL49913.1 ferrochelatase [Boudabousia marimammalium]
MARSTVPEVNGSEGIIVVALGSPLEPTEAAIRDFLREFLSDPRVVDFPRLLWLPILHGPLLRKRPREVLSQYEAIWTSEGSPLRAITSSQVQYLRNLLPHARVEEAYQYGSPNLVDVYRELASECNHITVLPTYPQYAPVTVESVLDRVNWGVQAAKSEGNDTPHLTALSWPTLPSYVNWYVGEIKRELAEEPVDAVIFSWHGVPKRKAHNPIEYQGQCHSTAIAIMEELHKQGVDVYWEETFQSKFGPGKWLEPATIDRMAQLPAEGKRKILVVNPGFFADCLETIYEMDSLNAEQFHQAGGEAFRRLAPPDGQQGAHMLAELYASLCPKG